MHNAAGLTFDIFVLVMASIISFAGYKIGTGRGRPVLGAVLGFLLGLIGLLILVVIPRTPEARERRRREQAARERTDDVGASF